MHKIFKNFILGLSLLTASTSFAQGGHTSGVEVRDDGTFQARSRIFDIINPLVPTCSGSGVCSITSIYEITDEGIILRPSDSSDDWIRVSGDITAPRIGSTNGTDIMFDTDNDGSEEASFDSAGNLTAGGFIPTDHAADNEGNYIYVLEDDNASGTTFDGTAGTLSLGDIDNTATDNYCFYLDTTQKFCIGSTIVTTADWDFGGGGIEIENGTTPPACTVGQLYLDTDATSGQRLMACEGGTFVKQGDGGGGMTSFNIDGDNTSPQSVGDGQTAFILGGFGITTTAAATRQVTVAVAPTEIGDTTWGDGVTDVSIDWLFNSQGENDVNLYFADNLMSINRPLDADMHANATAVLAAADDNDTSIASTSFVQQEINDIGGATTGGLSCSGGRCSVASGEQGFLASGALTCGASTDGKMQVHTTPLQYCDNSGPTLRYAAYGTSTGDASAITLTGPITTSSGVATTIASSVGGRSLAVNTNVLDADAELYTHTKCITIESPTSADDILFFRVDTAGTGTTWTVTGVDCLSTGTTPSATITVNECNSTGVSCNAIEAGLVCDNAGDAEVGGLDDATIDNGDWIRVDVTANSGTITQTGLCLTYTVAD